MKVYFRAVAVVIVLLAMLVGCNSVPFSSDPLWELNIPESGYEECFSPVESAVLYVDGAQRQIDPDDPRLIRVLSFLGYAEETMQCNRTQGVLNEDEISQYYSIDAIMLEVTFSADLLSTNEFRSAPKMLVCGDTYLLFMDYAENPCAERHWPYAELAPEGASQSNYDLSWGNDCWLNILEYCGF